MRKLVYLEKHPAFGLEDPLKFGWEHVEAYRGLGGLAPKVTGLGEKARLGRDMGSSPRQDLLHVEVRLYSTLRKYAPASGEPSVLELPVGSTVASAIEALGIPEETPIVILLNGRHASPSHCLGEGDRLVFFPPVEGG